jgi:hypothetical protein
MAHFNLFPAKTANAGQKNPHPYKVRGMRRVGNWKNEVALLSFFTASGFGVWSECFWGSSLISFAVSVLILLIINGPYELYLRYLIPCPKCKKKLKLRIVKDSSFSTRSWYFYDCPVCAVSWDPCHHEDESTGS